MFGSHVRAVGGVIKVPPIKGLEGVAADAVQSTVACGEKKEYVTGGNGRLQRSGSKIIILKNLRKKNLHSKFIE